MTIVPLLHLAFNKKQYSRLIQQSVIVSDRFLIFLDEPKMDAFLTFLDGFNKQWGELSINIQVNCATKTEEEAHHQDDDSIMSANL